MLDEARINGIRQKRMDALSAKHLHEYRLSSLNKLNNGVDLLAIGVPVLYFPIRYLAKGTNAGGITELLWEILAAVLIFSTVVKIVWKWSDRMRTHNKLMMENISLASQAEQLLNNANFATPDGAQWFLLLADNLEKADRESLGVIDEKIRKWAYREALKEFSPGNTQTCPECNASPWQYKPGSCQLCGNTPVPKRTVSKKGINS